MRKMLKRQHIWRSENFVNRKIEQYLKFLHICSLGGHSVPTLDIDFVWHLHQSFPKKYEVDTLYLCGRIINHDDNISDDKLAEQLKATQEMWEKEYKEVYPINTKEPKKGRPLWAYTYLVLGVLCFLAAGFLYYNRETMNEFQTFMDLMPVQIFAIAINGGTIFFVAILLISLGFYF
eukprot:UN31824